MGRCRALLCLRQPFPSLADGVRWMPRTALPSPAGGEGKVGAWLRKVMRADAGGAQKRHPELDAALLGQMQEPLPQGHSKKALGGEEDGIETVLGQGLANGRER